MGAKDALKAQKRNAESLRRIQAYMRQRWLPVGSCGGMGCGMSYCVTCNPSEDKSNG